MTDYQARRDEHCTHPSQLWCDCDWCRYLRSSTAKDAPREHAINQA